MCSLPYLLDAGDLEDRQLLTVTLALVIAGLVLELVDADLGALRVLEHLTGDGDLLQVLRRAGDLRSVDDEGDRQRDLGAGLRVELLDLDDVSDGDLVLLAAGLDDCVSRHRSSSSLGARYSWVRERVLGAGHNGPAVVGVSRKTTDPGYVSRAYRVKSPQVTACARSAFVGRWPSGTSRRAAAMPPCRGRHLGRVRGRRQGGVRL